MVKAAEELMVKQEGKRAQSHKDFCDVIRFSTPVSETLDLDLFSQCTGTAPFIA